jgi:hypothetical protein
VREFKEFIFDALLLETALQELEEKGGISTRPPTEATIVQRVEKLQYNPRIISEAAKMASVFTVFFCLENAVRELITERLRDRHGFDWWEKCVPSKIQTNVQTLMRGEQLHRYHTSRSSELIGYTTFGNLGQIVVNRWADFEDLFPDQAWISSRFKDLEMSRNIIMHTGILAQIEIDRVESIARDWVRQVG